MLWPTSRVLSLLAAGAAPILVTGAQVPLGPALPPHGQSWQATGVQTNLSAANFIFNGLDGLAQQLGNAVHPNGHSVVPAVISPYTLLYHARHDANPPKALDWLAFDAEMSYAIMAGIGLNTHLVTYSASRDLRVLYFDGMSAAKGPTGWLDTQEVLVNRMGAPVLSPGGWRDECNRIETLCAWAKPLGVDGFIRMETAFEVMFCDFSDGLDIVSNINITVVDSRPPIMSPPRAVCGQPSDLSSNDTRRSDIDVGEPPRAPRPGPPPGFPGRAGRSPFYSSARYEWIRVAARRFLSPVPGLRLVTSGLVTFYDSASFPSLAAARSNGDQVHMTTTRVWANISEADAQHAVERVESVLARPDLWTRAGVDWSRIARQVTEFWGPRIAQMNVTLTPTGGSELNSTLAVEAVRMLAYTLLDPYMDTSALPHSSTSESSLWLLSTLERCGSAPTAFVPPLSQLTPEERVLRASIETVLHRLCGFTGSVLAESMGADKANDDELARKWAAEVDALMNWLDWPMWLQCDERCGFDWQTLCVVPMWPAYGYRPRDPTSPPPKARPQCISFDDFIHDEKGDF